MDPHTSTTPRTSLDPRYSDPKATALPWSDAADRLAAAEVFWLTTVRPDGRPHVTPLIAVWSEGALHFCTGPDERKARNLAENPSVVLTTGSGVLDEGLDLVVEGAAAPVRDEERLRALAQAYVEKYGPDWRFDVREGAFVGDGGTAVVFAVAPRTVFGFAKGDPFGQTRWRF
ncbi:pyridoxamine 5'-phosphate oxidase family protein [Streptomyces narbonensis]|uniref:pyridoxamine 5'-phosphate oxidase family protein n=1 Tax=Streptomyces narbonensis TaxID=67333 RepID=UPI001672B1ED|nr:pyridoxamine 5'-phosphate oxidase family protein [Streptomyces narbonensis]GGV96962.1 pyridoxamine 5'-phosphate oxidase [Streptomyces narbonensis]